MRTIKGYQAIEFAEEFRIPVSDLQNQTEVSVEQAKQMIRNRRDPEMFALQNWPDTEDEAERIVLHHFHMALKDHHMGHASLNQLDKLDNGLAVNYYAAEFAVDRLVDSGQLERVDADRSGEIYRIPRDLYFRSSFLKELSDLVCEECAHLELDGPFHETCLTALIDYVEGSSFMFHEITEVREGNDPARRIPKIIPGIGLLSKTVSETRSKWQSVLKPIFNREGDAHPQGTSANAPSSDVVGIQANRTGEHVVRSENNIQRTEGQIDAGKQDTSSLDRARITKEDLIRYLRSVEVVDDTGEIVRLQNEKSQLLQRLAAKDKDIEQLEKQRAYWEAQFHELSRDMDTMLEAMQIAKRRGTTKSTSTVIDAEVEVDSRGTE